MSRIGAALLTAGMVTSGMAVFALPAQAAVPCGGNNLYAINVGTAGTPNGASVLRLDAQTGQPVETVIDPASPPGVEGNQLGVSPGGSKIYYTERQTAQVVEYDADTGTAVRSPALFADPPGAAQTNMGSVNPVNGVFYYGGIANQTTLRITAYDPATRTSELVADVQLAAPAANGDFAFDAAGNLYIVAARSGSAVLVRANGALPTHGPAVSMTSTVISDTISVPDTINGMAFGSDGYLYADVVYGPSANYQSAIYKIDPASGQIVSGPEVLSARLWDLASCADPITAKVQASFPQGRAGATDQTTVAITGQGVTTGNTGTTTGTDNGVQDQPGEVGGSVVILPGKEYTVTQTGTAGTDLTKYTTTWECVDTAHGNAPVANGTGNTGTFTTNAEGAVVTCTFTNVPTAAGDGPKANPDTGTTPQGVPITIDPSTNDTPGGAPLDPKSVKLLDPAGNPVDTLTVPGEGTYTVDPASGKVTFTPEPQFTGTAKPVPYRIADTAGKTTDSTITITVTPEGNPGAGPVALPDVGITPQNTPITVDPPSNDTPGLGGAPIDPKSVKLLDANGNPVDALTVPGEGTYRVDPATGKVTFTPEPQFVGIATPVPYRIADTAGKTADSLITITVTPGTGNSDGPKANPDTGTTPQNTPITIDPSTNDTPGAAPLDPKSVKLLDPAGNPVDTLTVTGEGTYRVDPATGKVTFTPEPQFTGTPKPVPYRIADTAGKTADSTITITVTPGSGNPDGPKANPDTGTTSQNTPITVDPLANDVPGQAPFDPTTVKLLDGNGNPVTELTVPGEGTYTVDPATGKVTFTPEPDFTGVATPVRYQVTDKAGKTVDSTITITVNGGDGDNPGPGDDGDGDHNGPGDDGDHGDHNGPGDDGDHGGPGDDGDRHHHDGKGHDDGDHGTADDDGDGPDATVSDSGSDSDSSQGSPSGSLSGDGKDGSDTLPFTGLEVTGISVLGLGAIGTGVAMLLGNRRRRRLQ